MSELTATAGNETALETNNCSLEAPEAKDAPEQLSDHARRRRKKLYVDSVKFEDDDDPYN